MIIDLHCHTKKVKSGDIGREVDVDTFKNKLEENKVKMVAITNHNAFFENQYLEFCKKCPEIIILPGIELDVIGDKSGKLVPCHIIVISDPKEISKFNQVVSNKCVYTDPDIFSITISDFCSSFGKLTNSIIMCHYKKTKNITDDDFKYLKNNIDLSNVAILEPSSARKAGIIIRGNKETSWFGSDNHDWANYPNDNNHEKTLPECLFALRDYNALLSLLRYNQDAVLLKTFLNNKGPEKIEISLFSDLFFSVDLYKAVNVIYGAKATGKTEILKAIEQELKNRGKNVSSFYIENKSNDLQNLLSYIPSEDDLKPFKDNKCDNEFSIIKGWNWKELPNISSFYNAKKNESALSLKNKAKILNAKFADILDDSHYITDVKEYHEIRDKVNSVFRIKKNNYLTEEQCNQLDKLLLLLVNNSKEKAVLECCKYYSKKLEKYTIDSIGDRISDLQGTIKAPSSYGFIQIYEEYNKIQTTISTIKKSIECSVVLGNHLIGELPTKGYVYRSTKIGFKQQPKSIHSEFKRKQYYDTCKDGDIKKLCKYIDDVENAKKISDYVSKITELKKYLIDNNLNDLMHYINYVNTYKTNFSEDFKPSNGEASILLVNHTINKEDVDVIILDEPDSGMGSDYINDVLLKEINAQAKNNKIILISTHDPNLVVRTHPYQCIFREEYDIDKYKTYVGSSFEEYLYNVNDKTDLKSWTKTCIEKCEGGEDAITERERTYGHY